MGMSAAERMRKYRENMKNDPAKYAQYLNREKQRYKKRKETGELRRLVNATIEKKELLEKSGEMQKGN